MDVSQNTLIILLHDMDFALGKAVQQGRGESFLSGFSVTDDVPGALAELQVRRLPVAVRVFFPKISFFLQELYGGRYLRFG